MSDFVYHKPKDRTIIQKEDYMLETETGDIALMCPKCFHMIETKISYSKIINASYNDISCFSTNNQWYGICTKCGESVKFEEIDANLAKTMNILNTKGYYTAFCCEGHIGKDIYGDSSFSNPYIYFYFWEDAKVLETYPLPDTWYISDAYNKCEIFSIEDSIMKKVPVEFKNDKEYNQFVDWMKENWNQEKSLRDIYNWAVSLPTKSLAKRITQRKIIEKYREDILDINAEKTVAAQFE